MGDPENFGKWVGIGISLKLGGTTIGSPRGHIIGSISSIGGASGSILIPRSSVSRIKCLGPGLYDFVDEDETFSDWLRKNPYSDYETKDPVTKDPLFQETEKTSGQTQTSIHKITKPLAMVHGTSHHWKNYQASGNGR